MRSQETRLGLVAFYLAVSAFGLVISASLLSNSAPFPSEPSGRRALVALAYGAVCVAGILAALFPVACSGFLGIHRSLPEDKGTLEPRATRIFSLLLLHGHHSPGSDEKRHELWLGVKSYCATCYGLLTGAVASLTAIVAFALSGWRDGSFAYTLYSVGVAVVILGLIPSLGLRIGARARFALAAVFVLGTCLMLVATDILTANLTADLFVVLLAVFWLLSRISLSHRRE
ncbi:hypothetical protein [[Eubacterium] cellulosolvens]